LKKVIFLVVAVLLISLVVVGCTQPAATTVTTTATTTATVTKTAAAEEPEVIKWTMAAMMADAEPFGYFADPQCDYKWMMHSLSDRGYADFLELISGGRLQVTIVEPEAVFPTSETIENIGQGVIEIAHISQGWLTGSEPACNVAMGLPMAWPTAASAMDCYHSFGFGDVMDEIYAERNLWAEFVPTDEIMGFITTFDAPDAASIKGHKIRVWGAYGKMVEAMGGLPVSMAYADVYMGMKLGTVEGSTTAAQALENTKLKEVCVGMSVRPKTNTPVNAIVINMDSFNALPDDIKAIIEEETKNYTLAMAGIEHMQNQLVVANAVKEYGIKIWEWSAEDESMLRELAKSEVWPYYGGLSAKSQELLDIMIKYMQTVGLLK